MENRIQPPKSSFGLAKQRNRTGGNQGPASLALHPAVGAPKQDRSDCLEKEVGNPNDEVWHELGPVLEGLSHKNEAVVRGHQHKGHSDSDVSLTPMHTYAQRYAHKGESKARE